MNLPDEIILIRKKGFYTQTEFAKQIGVSFSTVNRWENGKMIPNISAMKRLKAYCETLNIAFENLENAWLEKITNQDNKE